MYFDYVHLSYPHLSMDLLPFLTNSLSQFTLWLFWNPLSIIWVTKMILDMSPSILLFFKKSFVFLFVYFFSLVFEKTRRFPLGNHNSAVYLFSFWLSSWMFSFIPTLHSHSLIRQSRLNNSLQAVCTTLVESDKSMEFRQLKEKPLGTLRSSFLYEPGLPSVLYD